MKKYPALIYQRKDYTCGIACLQTVARLLGKPVFPAAFMERRLGTTPDTGTNTPQMIEWAQQRLPYTSAGEGLWTGQLAITLTTLVEDDGSREAHYEVLLGRLHTRIVSWCPYLATLRVAPDNHINWTATLLGKSYSRWTLNFAHRYREDELLKFLGVTGTQRLCLPSPTLHTLKDSTPTLEKEIDKRPHFSS